MRKTSNVKLRDHLGDYNKRENNTDVDFEKMGAWVHELDQMVHQGKQTTLSDSIKAGNFQTSGVPINLKYGPFTFT
jgi:hypothetical protein